VVILPIVLVIVSSLEGARADCNDRSYTAPNRPSKIVRTIAGVDRRDCLLASSRLRDPKCDVRFSELSLTPALTNARDPFVAGRTDEAMTAIDRAVRFRRGETTLPGTPVEPGLVEADREIAPQSGDRAPSFRKLRARRYGRDPDEIRRAGYLRRAFF
jgi:hypothetical protein